MEGPWIWTLMKATNISGGAIKGKATYQMHFTFMKIGNALSAPVFYYSLLLNVSDLNAEEIFAGSRRDEREGGGAVWAFFTVNTLSCRPSLEIA
jgi:hypothetical protein